MGNTNIIYKETKEILKKCRLEIILKTIISICYRGTLLIIPILWSKAIDLLTKGIYEEAYKIVFITLIVTIGYYISVSVNQVIYYKLYNKMYQKYNSLIYKAIVKNSLYSLSRFQIGEFNNVTNNDVDIVVAFLSDTIIKIVQLFEIFIIFYYFCSVNLTIYLITLILSIVMLAVFIKTGKTTNILNQERKKYLDKKFAATHEVYNTIKEIKGFYIFKNINSRIKNVCINYLDANASYNNYSIISRQFILGTIEVFRYLIAIYGMYLCSLGRMEIGTILVIYTYYGKLTDSYGIVGTLMLGIEDFKVSSKRLNKLLEYRLEEEKETLPEKVYKGDIKFDDVLYGNKKDPILNRVTLKINSNSITAITGSPGTGKTGIFDLLMKMNRKHSGQILIDGDSYEEINDDLYYNLVSIARKEPHFFDLSIKENLMLVNPDFSKIEEVCKKIGIHDEISELKNKYDTMINDSSEKISNNLKVAVAIARVILKDSKIMMFDETICMLDNDSENIVLNLLKELKKDHTIILITREQKELAIADKIITFENNKIKNVRLNKEKE